MFFRDDETQVIALKIVKCIQSKLQPSEVSELLPLICGFCVSPSIPCRNVMYDILMWVYDNYRYRHTICKAPLFVSQIICIFMHRAYFYCPCFQRLLYVSVHVMTGTHYYSFAYFPVLTFYREDESETADTIMQQTKESLLKGLGDDDMQCRYGRA